MKILAASSRGCLAINQWKGCNKLRGEIDAVSAENTRLGDGTMHTLTKLSFGLLATTVGLIALVQPVLAHDLELFVQAPGARRRRRQA